MNATAEYREAVLRPLAALLGSLGTERQQAWSTFIASAGLEGIVPSSNPMPSIWWRRSSIRSWTDLCNPVSGIRIPAAGSRAQLTPNERRYR